jgi:geranylgeranyl reductase family protein
MSLSDVVIVGGGPAGLYTARTLARAGRSVTLFEEHPRVGEPVHCTGVLASEAFEEFGIEPGAVLNQLTTVRFHAPSGDTIAYSPRSVQAVVIDRQVFDQSLAQEAMEAGVRLVQARVAALTVEATGVTVHAGSDRVQGRACVLACGASYGLQRRLGLGVPPLMMRSAQVELPAKALGEVDVFFGSRVAPGGFGWVVPVLRGDRAFVRIGVMCRDEADRYFSETLAAVCAARGVPCGDVRPRRKVLPIEPIPRTFADRVVAVGDAAGLVKSTTGGGIYYSLVSARLAAETLLDALDRNDLGPDSLSTYESRWRRLLGPELRSQALLRHVTERLEDADIDGLFELARTDGIMPLIRRTAAFNQHRPFIVALLKHPPARRLLFKSALA